MKVQVNRRRGQAATEYMMVVSVLVIAVVGAAYAFVPTFQVGVEELGHDVSEILVKQGSARGGFGLAGGTVSDNGGVMTSGQAAESGTVRNYDPMSGMGDSGMGEAVAVAE